MGAFGRRPSWIRPECRWWVTTPPSGHLTIATRPVRQLTLRMPLTRGFVPPCIPTRAHKAPTGPDWVHEIKHNGYRLQVHRDGDTVRLFTRRGYDWTGRYPAIAATAAALRARSFTLDGEAVVCGPDGIAIFDALHRHVIVWEAMLYAFDLLDLDGDDLRGLPATRPQKAAGKARG